MKFSIITPTYNRADLISILINDVLVQSYPEWEFILVDDGSADNTKQVVLSFQDERIKYIYQNNAERSAARNNGIDHATGEFIVFIDSDDTIPSNFLEELHKTIKSNNYRPAIYSTRRKYKVSGEYKYTRQLKSTDTADSILKAGEVIFTDQCVHRSLLVKHRFKSTMEPWEDTHLFLRLLSLYPVIESNAVIHMLIHEGSTVQQGLAEVKMSNVRNYTRVVFDLLEYADLFPSEKYKPILMDYVYKKHQMYFYQARINKQWDIAYTILKESMRYKFDFIYILKSYIHVLLKS